MSLLLSQLGPGADVNLKGASSKSAAGAIVCSVTLALAGAGTAEQPGAIGAPGVGAAVAFRSSETASGDTCNKPTGTAVHDVLLAAAVSYGFNVVPTVTPPAGWTPVNVASQQTIGTDTEEVRLSVFLRKADGTEGSSFTFTSDGTLFRVTIGAYQNCDTVTPQGAVATNQGGESSTATTLGLTPVREGSRVVAMIGLQMDQTLSTPAGMTLVSSTGRIGYFDQLLGNVASGNKASTLGASTQWAAVMACLQPGLAGPGVSATAGLSPARSRESRGAALGSLATAQPGAASGERHGPVTSGADTTIHSAVGSKSQEARGSASASATVTPAGARSALRTGAHALAASVASAGAPSRQTRGSPTATLATAPAGARSREAHGVVTSDIANVAAPAGSRSREARGAAFATATMATTGATSRSARGAGGGSSVVSPAGSRSQQARGAFSIAAQVSPVGAKSLASGGPWVLGYTATLAGARSLETHGAALVFPTTVVAPVIIAAAQAFVVGDVDNAAAVVADILAAAGVVPDTLEETGAVGDIVQQAIMVGDVEVETVVI